MKRSILLAVCAVVPSGGLANAQTVSPSPAAQPVSEADDGVADIVVTALKADKRLLDTPATVTVLAPEALQRANIANVNQLSNVVPGLVMAQGVSTTAVTFRGLGSSAADPAAESSVSLFVDGLYLGHSRDFVAPLYDVAQVELIKGTQATLLGKNTSLGAISITNRRPGAAVGYDVSTAHSTGLGGLRVQGGVDVPLGKDFAVRVAGFANREDGYVRNLYRDVDERRVRELSGRLTLTGTVGAADLTLIYQHDDRDSSGNYLELLSDPAGVVRARATALGQARFDSVGNDRSYSGADAVGPGAVGGPQDYDDQSGNRAILIATVPLGRYTFTAQTSYMRWQSDRVTDLDLTRARLLDFSDDETNAVLTQEVRLSSPAGDRFGWLLGGF